MNNKGSLASFSDYGSKTVHVAAPGLSILGTLPGGTWDYLNGTSMAAPHATGVAALAASETPSLLDGPGALKQVIMKTGKPASATNGKTVTGDMVDADAAIAADAPSNTPPSISDVLPVNGTSTKNRRPLIEATATDSWTELKASSLTLKINGKTVPSSSFSYDGNKNRLSYTPATNMAYGKHTVELIATDGQETASETWSFTIEKKKKKR